MVKGYYELSQHRLSANQVTSSFACNTVRRKTQGGSKNKKFSPVQETIITLAYIFKLFWTANNSFYNPLIRPTNP